MKGDDGRIDSLSVGDSESSPSRFFTCRIGIEEEMDTVAISLEDLDMRGSEGCAAGGDSDIIACFAESDDIKIALDHDDRIVFFHSLLEMVDTVECLRLIIDDAITTVEIFGLLISMECSGTEGDDIADMISDRDRQPITKKRIIAILSLLHESCLCEIFDTKSLLITPRDIGLTGSRSVTETIFGDERGREFSLVGEVGVGISNPSRPPLVRGGGRETLYEESLRNGGETFEFLFVGCEFLMVFSFGFEVFELDMIGLSKSSDGVTIVETLDIHIEADRISSFSTSKAFIDLLGRRDEKRRGLFTMKRTKTSVVTA